MLCFMSGKKASVPRSERAKWRGREKRRKRSFGATFRLFLSRSYLECKTVNSSLARTMNWGIWAILFECEIDVAGAFISL